MGDHHDGLAVVLVEHLEQQHDLVRGGTIQIARGLVADEERRIGDDGARDGDALLLAARQLLWLVPGTLAQADERERDLGVPPSLGRAQAGEQQRQLHVALGREHREQVVELKDEADAGRAPA